MLAQLYAPDKLSSILLSRQTWRPYPAAAEREAWQSLPELVRQAHIMLGEATLEYEWPELQAVRFLDYARNGNRSRYEKHHFNRRAALAGLVIAECMEGQGRFVDDIVNGVWAICEESYWGVPAHVGVQQAGTGLPDVDEPTVDLFAAETGALLAWTAYLVGPQLDGVSPLVLPRIEREVGRRILHPGLERDDFRWMGFQNTGRRVNNWNPWICSNWLAAGLLLEADPERRLATVSKILATLDNFIDPYPRDGGCDEGPSYWGRAGASLFDCLELLYSATAGQLDVYDEPLIQNIGRFIYKAQIADHYFINFADAPAVVLPSPYIVYKYGRRIGDKQMAALGIWAAVESDLFRRSFAKIESKHLRKVSVSLGRELPALFSLNEMIAEIGDVEPGPPLPRDVWLDEIQVMTARDKAGSSEGLFVAAKGGNNNESHNHNDIGNFIVYVDGRPILIDAGVETYTAKTFSAQRYEIWTMQSGYHNLPTIGGIMQAPGPEFAAGSVQYGADDMSARLSLDIAPAYPPEAGLTSWQRTVTLNRGRDVEVSDAYLLAEPVREITFSLMTPCEVSLEERGRISLQPAKIAGGRKTGAAQISYDGDKFTVSTERIPLSDERLTNIWGSRLIRIIFRAEDPPVEDQWLLQVWVGGEEQD